MRQRIRRLLPHPVGAGVRLLLAMLLPSVLGHTPSHVVHAQCSIQPSWVDQLPLNGTPVEGVLGTTQDIDYYRIQVTDLTEAVIYSRSELDTQATLLDSVGRQIASDDHGGEGRNFRIVAFLNAGDYYLRIKQNSFGTSAAVTGKYALHGEGAVLSPARLSLDGSPQEGAIEPRENADYFRFEVAELTKAVIHTTGGLDTIGRVLNSEGREIVSDDDGGEGRNFRVTALLWPGEYFLRVNPWVSSSGHRGTGSYNLHAEGMPASIAQLPLDGSSKEGVIEPGEDGDYFRIEVTALTEAVLYTSGWTDTIGTLLDTEGREIVSDDHGGEGRNFRLVAILRPGAYYVRVAQAGNGGFLPHSPAERAAPDTGSYTLHAQGAAVSPIPLRLNGAPAEGSIDSGQDADYYRIEVTELTEVAVYTSGGLDVEGALLNSEGSEIVSDDDGGSGGNFRVATLLWPGEYFVRVTPWVKFSGQFDIGSYALHSEGMSASPVHLSLNGPPRDSVIETGEDQDYFRLEVTEPVAVALYTSGNLDTAGVLFAANGVEYASNDDGGEQFINFRITEILFRPGEYFLRVYSSSGSQGNYALHAEGILGGR